MKKIRLARSVPPALLVFISGCTHRPVVGPMGNWDHMMGFGGYGGIFMWLTIIVVVAVIVYLIVNRNLPSGGSGSGARESPLDVLKRRYAQGDISKEEFDRMKREIEE